jgi:hypothetical protein
MVGLFYPILFGLGLSVFLCIASARTFAVARRSNSMELLMTTPLGVDGVIEGHLAGLRKIFFLPSLIILATFAVYLLIAHVPQIFGETDRVGEPSGFDFYWLAGFALLLVATPWIGMWMGLRAKTPARAVVATLTLVLIVPRLGFCWMIDPFYFIAMWFIAQRRVRAGFQQLISERFTTG